MIISLLEKQDLAILARVRRNWSGIALDWLWRDLPNIVFLIHVLRPLILREEDKHWAGAIRITRLTLLYLTSRSLRSLMTSTES